MAIGHFVGDGLEATSLEKIRLEAGVSNGSLYHYFPTKAHLVRALYVAALRSFHADLLAVLRRDPDAEAGVKGLVRAYFRWVETHPELARVLQELRSTDAVMRSPEIEASNDEAFGALRTWVRGRIEAGRMRDLAFPVWMALVFAPLTSLTRTTREGPRIAARTRAQVADALWASVSNA